MDTLEGLLGGRESSDKLILCALVCTHVDMVLAECEKHGVSRDDVIDTIHEARAKKEALAWT